MPSLALRPLNAKPLCDVSLLGETGTLSICRFFDVLRIKSIFFSVTLVAFLVPAPPPPGELLPAYFEVLFPLLDRFLCGVLEDIALTISSKDMRGTRIYPGQDLY